MSALFTLFFVLLSCAPAHAAQINPARLAQFEDYLNSINTVEADFVQVASTGQMARGQLFMSRPGHMRVDYAPPSPILIIANGTFLIYFDRDLKQTSYLPLRSTPAAILLDDKIRLNQGDLRVVSMTERDGLARITVQRHENPGEGSITLIFSTSPIALKRWEVHDSQDVVTTVSLVNPHFGVPLDNELFEFADPQFFGDDFN
ncbi:MAG: outer membrane lipoprotein carrier protein LolA [Hyphomicrobiales bacterium]|nr:outer membrane lipoprotein carrier protein LolA [Hyphomicrobiales bacterium]